MRGDQLQTPGPSAGKNVAPSPATGLRRFNRIGCVLLPLMILAVVWISYYLSARSAERALEAEIERLTAAGIIVPIKDLIPKVPPGERNAADVYEQAFAAFVPPSPEDSELLRSNPWDAPERLAAARRLVAQNEVYFPLLDEAASLPYCAWPVNWRQPYEAHADILRLEIKLRDVVGSQEYRAQAFAASDNPDAALEGVAVWLRMSGHVQRMPTWVSQAHLHAMQYRVMGTTTTVLSAADPSAEACRSLFDVLAGIDNMAASVEARKGTVAIIHLPVLQDIHARRSWEGELKGPLDYLSSLYMPWQERVRLRAVALAGGAIVTEDIIHYLRYQEKLIRAYSLPWPESRSALREAAAELEAAPAIQSQLSQQLACFWVDLRRLVTRDSQTARLRAAQIGLAAAAYRAEHGDYPDSLDELTAAGWDLPSDPFGGGPLHYQREGSGFVVWSVGPNLMDDNAVEHAGEPMSLDDGAYDIVFRCERSQHAGAEDRSP